jgi:hypothetical protein
MTITRRLVPVLGLLALLPGHARASADCFPVNYYGTYSIGRKAGDAKVPLASRLDELKELGGNMIVGTGDDREILDALPRGLLAVPGCGLMGREDWQVNGRWNEPHAREKLAALARRFANDPRVFGVCLTHEVTEYADHARRRWMYQLAKGYFPDKKVIQYYGRLWDNLNPTHKKTWGYGLEGEIETDVLFVSVQAVHKGHFDPDKVRKLKEVLGYAARTPGIPVWVQTSINADHKYVDGARSMITVWGKEGENMSAWTDALFRAVHRDDAGHELRLSGFFWRSLGRFPFDLGYPAFSAQRARMAGIGKRRCPS